MIKIWARLSVTTSFLLCCSGNAPVDDREFSCEGEIKFVDTELEQIIADAATTSIPISGDMVTNLTELEIKTPGVLAGDLSGMQCLISLRSLILDSQNIDNIEPLHPLINLEKLDLSYNFIADIRPLGEMTSLRILDLGQNDEIADASSLSELVKLEEIDLTSAMVPDLNFVSKMTELKILEIGFNFANPIHLDLSPLANCPKLSKLTANDNGITDLSALSGNVELNWLLVDHNAITDIDVLAKLTNLDVLDISFNDITDINALVNNPGIGSGDNVNIKANPIDCDDTGIQDAITALEERGVVLECDCN